MQPYFQEQFGNPSSALHSLGWQAEKALSQARQTCKNALSAQDYDLFFTSGATESNNWALRGLVEQCRLQHPQDPIHILSSPIEHAAVGETLRHLQKLHGEFLQIEFVPCQSNGQIQVEDVEKRIRSNTRLLSFMWVNNELGTINPISELTELAKQNQIYLHTDATQAPGKVTVNLQQTPVDLLALSAHKIYGPKGTGALLIRKRNPRVSITSLLVGGGQELGQRAGTVNVAGAVGLAKALELVQELKQEDTLHAQSLRAEFLMGLAKSGLEFKLNGSPEGVASIINLQLLNVTAHKSFSGLAYSQGSACHSHEIGGSPVLKAIGLANSDAERSFRFSWGRQTVAADIAKAVEILSAQIQKT